MSLHKSPILLLVSALMLILAQNRAAVAQKVSIRLNYKESHPATYHYAVADAFFISIINVDHDTKAKFLDSTKIWAKKVDTNQVGTNASLTELIAIDNAKKPDSIKRDAKLTIDNLEFELSVLNITKGDTLFIKPFLNGKLADSSITITLAAKQKMGDTETHSLPCPVDTIEFTDESMFAGIRPNEIIPIADQSGSNADFLIFYNYQTGVFYNYKLKKNALGEKSTNHGPMLSGSANGSSGKQGADTRNRFRYVTVKKRNPSAGDQFKFEVINKPIDEQLSLHVTYDDYFLDEGSTFSAFFTGKAQQLLFPGQTADTRNSTPLTKQEALIINNTICDSLMLVKLEKQLDDYGRRFPINSVTISRNLQNIAVIRKRIDSAFGLHGQGLETLAVRDGFGPTLADVIKDISKKLDGLTDAKPLFFSTARLHDNDVLNIQIKDGTQNVVKDESFRIGWGIKIDFSVGVFLSGLTDRTYTFKDTLVQISDGNSSSPRDTSGRILIPEKKDDMNLGFGTLAHVYTRVSSNLNAGLVCGVMSNSDLNLRLLAGGSLMFSSLFGSHMRVAFSGGISWGQVKRLSEAYETGYHTEAGKPYFYPSNINAPNTVNVWRNSWFFGMTFNFGKK